MEIVASHVDAWIETEEISEEEMKKIVASHVDAWIETNDVACDLELILSHPTWMRGLKHELDQHQHEPFQVASHVDAWIET